ncbi:MAG: GAF domain-containing protein, partial [Gammaproteobacteria bacterium]|nr:GAF domain-containing protein [Gammaproteobacteria bacterium]
MDAPGKEESGLDEAAALRFVLEGTASQTGEPFFRALVETLSKALGYRDAWVTELIDTDHLRSLAAWMDGEFVANFDYPVQYTPCEPVIRECRFVHHPDHVQEAYPEDPELLTVGAVSYMGVPLMDVDGTTLGHLALLGDRPKPAEPLGLAVLKIFAARAE